MKTVLITFLALSSVTAFATDYEYTCKIKSGWYDSNRRPFQLLGEATAKSLYDAEGMAAHIACNKNWGYAYWEDNLKAKGECLKDIKEMMVCTQQVITL